MSKYIIAEIYCKDQTLPSTDDAVALSMLIKVGDKSWSIWVETFFFPEVCPPFCCLVFSMDGADLCFEIVKRADAGFVYSEAVAR